MNTLHKGLDLKSREVKEFGVRTGNPLGKGPQCGLHTGNEDAAHRKILHKTPNEQLTYVFSLFLCCYSIQTLHMGQIAQWVSTHCGQSE